MSTLTGQDLRDAFAKLPPRTWPLRFMAVDDPRVASGMVHLVSPNTWLFHVEDTYAIKSGLIDIDPLLGIALHTWPARPDDADWEWLKRIDVLAYESLKGIGHD